MADVMARQTQLLEILTHNTTSAGGTSKLGEFMRTKPPTFATSKEPLDIDDWLHTIEKKLDIARYGNPEKVLYASRQLEGPIEDWWDNFKAAQEEDHIVTWNEFTVAFHEFFIPT